MSAPEKRPSLLHGRSRLQIAIIINQLATPGLGSWVAGRKIAGAGQLTFSITGFLLFVWYFILLMTGMVRSLQTGIESLWPPAFWWKSALATFAFGWLWAAVTSFSLYRELGRTPTSPPQPPVLPPPE
jgi:hypothetical protein